MSQGAKGIYGVTDTFDGSSNDLSGTTGDLKDPMESNGVLRGPRGSRRAFRGFVGPIGTLRESQGAIGFVWWAC